MSTTELHTETTAGTIGGTLLALVLNIGTDILHTAIMTCVGAVVSFGVSLLLKKLVEFVGKKRKAGD